MSFNTFSKDKQEHSTIKLFGFFLLLITNVNLSDSLINLGFQLHIFVLSQYFQVWGFFCTLSH